LPAGGLHRCWRAAARGADRPDEDGARGDADRPAAVASTLSRAGRAPGTQPTDLPTVHAATQRERGTQHWPGQERLLAGGDLNRQARAWCDALNRRVHQTTHEVPLKRWAKEHVRPLPTSWSAQRQPHGARERFFAEERVVSWDGSVAYDGVLYGMPGPARWA